MTDDLVKCRRVIARAIRLCSIPDVAAKLKEAHRLVDKALPVKPRKKKTPKQLLFQQCMDLWAEVVKLRANSMSEYDCATHDLQSHHIMGKSNDWLRFSLDNGICLTSYQHGCLAHGRAGKAKEQQFAEWVMKYVSQERWNKLLILKHKSGKPDLRIVKVQLEEAKRLCG
jgi:hypothetical protein